MQRAFHTAGYLAVWAGLYVVGAVVCLSQTAGLDATVSAGTKGHAAAFAFFTAAGVYLLDRVKVFDSWLDPSDAKAHPARFAFLAHHAGWVRILILVLLVTASWLGTTLVAWGAIVPLLAAGGVLAYAARPRASRPRPKDIVLVKNAYVAAGITGFAAIVATAAVQPGVGPGGLLAFATDHVVTLALSCALLALRVFADAALCDLDDEEADRRHGTHTLPTDLGRMRAWNVALGLRLGLSVALVLAVALPIRARLAWAGVTVVSSVWLRLAAPVRVRDWVDARLPIESALVAVILAL